MATQTQHIKLAHAINHLIAGRQNRLAGAMVAAMQNEKSGERLLTQLFTADQVDELMTAWECSLSTNPLELPEWKSILNPE